MPSRELGPSLSTLAAAQGGVLHRAQILDRGRTEDWIKAQLVARRWARVFPGTYATFTGPLPWLSHAWAAVLYAGRGAVLGGESALLAAGMRRNVAPLPIVVCVPHERNVEPPRGVVYHRRRHLSQLSHAGGGPPRLRLEIAVLETASDQRGAGRAIGVIADACQQRLTTPDRLEQAMALKPRLRWRTELAAVVADVSAGAYSFLEAEYMRRVERPHGLPTGTRQRSVRTGRRRWYRDVEYVGFGVISELDGRLGHEALLDRASDMVRDNAASHSGAATYRFGYVQVTERSCETAGIVADALRRRGWRESVRRCGAECQLRG